VFTDVMNKLGLTLSSASRNVKLLSTLKVREGKSFGLIDYRQDMNDYRRQTLHLTSAGIRVVNKVVNIMGE